MKFLVFFSKIRLVLPGYLFIFSFLGFPISFFWNDCCVYFPPFTIFVFFHSRAPARHPLFARITNRTASLAFTASTGAVAAVAQEKRQTGRQSQRPQRQPAVEIEERFAGPPPENGRRQEIGQRQHLRYFGQRYNKLP